MLKLLKKSLVVSAAAPAAVVAGPAAGGADAPAAEEQSEFNVVLTSAGAAKINVIKVVREITGFRFKRSQRIG